VVTVAAPRLALFTYSAQPRGSVVHTAHLADALHDAGWAVTVYALDKDGRGFFRALRADLHLIPAGPAPSSTAALVRQRRQELVAHLAGDGGLLPGTTVAQHDIYHAQDCLTATALLDLRAHGRGPPLVRTVHHVEQFSDPYLAHCQERSIREADLCLTVSRAAQRDVERGHGVRAFRVGNGVCAERFWQVDQARVAAWRARLGPGGPVVLAVGGIEERKNSLRLLRAFAQVRADHPGARLWILGGATVLDHGAYRAAFERERQALPAGTRDAVVELGVLPEDDVPALYHLADVLALPSLHEGFGLAALEALAAGVPVVAADRPPFTEFLDESFATLVDPLCEQAIAAGVRRALDDTAARRERGLACAEHHSWARVAALHVEHYHRLLREETIRHAGDALRRSLA
jgi:glycosyltransferase-like protein